MARIVNKNYRVELRVPNVYAEPFIVDNGEKRRLSMHITDKLWFQARSIKAAQRKATAFARQRQPALYKRITRWRRNDNLLPPLYVQRSKADPNCYIALENVF